MRNLSNMVQSIKASHMLNVSIRIHFKRPTGQIEDGQQDFDLASFGGFLPSIGDMILDPGVLASLDRRQRQNRRMWTVVGRVFNPRDNADYIALIVEERQPNEREDCFVPYG
ncbi:hypothetical protein ACW7BJ_21665 [Azospirillum argentinense]